MTAPLRTPSGGAIDRERTVEFTFDGARYTGHPGDTVASALLAHGVHAVASSVKLGRPRGISASWAEDSGGLIQVERPFPEPMLLATTVEVVDGLEVAGLPGQGRLADTPDPARYDARHLHCDVLVVGAGPAGLAAALAAARRGDRVALVDERALPGGALRAEPGGPALDWVDAAAAELAGFAEVTHLQRTTAFGHYDDGFMLALERRTDHLASPDPRLARQRVWRIRAKSTVIATGAHERPIVFSGNDLPGVMLAASARDFLHRYGVRAGERAAVFTTGDTAYAAAFDLHDAGTAVVVVVDARADVPAHLAAGCADRGIELRAGAVVRSALGESRVTGVEIVPDGAAAPVATVDCDTLLVSGGWNPAVHLFSQVRGRLRFDDALGAFVPAEELDGVAVAGSAAGAVATADCIRSGGGEVPPELDGPAPSGLPARVLWRVPQADPDTSFVDVQRDVTVTEVLRAIGAGMHSMEHIKRYTTIGTAHDQGKTSGVIASGITADALGVPVGDLGTTTFRPPYTPVAFAALAGRSRGRLFDPVRTTPIHDWHVERGAVFEDVGQWKRPRYYPLGDGLNYEDMDTAVLRECAAVRGGVGILDGSTLGKIDVSGPDAPRFMDMMYTNLMSTLKVGMIRYGVMCGVDGMVIDDGTVMRLAEDRYVAFTTTGGAAAVLDWMEEWLQTEWPDWQVYLTSVTDHQCTFPVVGPKSRELIGRVTADLDVSNEAFGFMAWRDSEIAGVPVRLGRVSFSGELAYEVNVEAGHARRVWDALIAAGADLGLTPYGTETMHVLRAEKGYPIIGQDTDGTVTPHDLGMGWAVSKKKPDFLGKRSFSRAENRNPLRKQFVGLLPTNASTVLPEGAQVIEFVEDGELPPPPVPMLGHVTSSYRSAELGRPFALALVKGGRDRIGEVLHVPVAGNLVPVEVTGTVLVDPDGARRDG